MSRPERERAGTRDAEHGLLLLMEPGRDRDLLGEWLGAIPRYGVLARDPEGSLPEIGEYDLCILDWAALERREVELRDREREADPLFLPCLLVVPEDADGAYGTGEGSVVDDVVTLPAEKGVLHRRIENLLEARRAFLRLRERERQYEELVDLAPEAILVLRDREIVYSNSAALEVFGAPEPEDLHGRAIMSLAGEAGREELATLVDEIDRGRRVREFRELRMESVDGEEIRAEAAGVRITFGEEPAIQLVIRDVTDEYEREQRLDLFGKAIQTAIQGITIADASQPDEPLIYANNAFEEITGYSMARVMGRNCRFLQGERTDEAKVRRLQEAIDAGEPVSVELLNYRKNGTPFWNRVEIVPITDDGGEVTHFLGLQRDVTQRKGREERLQVLSRVLRHNLRTSMNVIMGYAGDLRDGEGIRPRRASASSGRRRASSRSANRSTSSGASSRPRIRRPSPTTSPWSSSASPTGSGRNTPRRPCDSTSPRRRSCGATACCPRP